MNNIPVYKKLNTRIENNTIGTTVILYNTKIVYFDDKFIILDNGNFMTNTTKNRMNQTSKEYNLNFYVYQKDFKWFVNHNGKTTEFMTSQVTITR